MKKIQLFLKYLILLLFLIAWIIIMFFTDCMNSQSFKLYCMFVVGVDVHIQSGRRTMYRMQNHILQKKH